MWSSRFKEYLKRILRSVRNSARLGQLAVEEFSSPLYSLHEMRGVARDAHISYLKSSGERIADLLTMSDDDLRKWYGIVKKQNERQQEMLEKRRAELERQRRARR